MKLLISSDWHLLAKRTANTTPKSRLRLKDALGKAISRIINCVPALECGRSICVGDLYDTYKNDVGDLLDTVAPFMATDIVLAGNHDLLAHADSISSLVFMDMLKHKFPFDPSEPVPKVIYGKLGLPHLEEVPIVEENAGIGGGYRSKAKLYFIPHVYTQELFESSLDAALAEARTSAANGWKCYLFLHCNIDSGFAEGSDIALNLTTERAKALLDAGISKIFCGHEHEPRDLLQGRLIIVGNTHPTSFADISSKRFLVLDTDTGEVESHQCYDAGAHYCAVDWLSCDVALEDPLPAGPETENVHWVRLTGTANASQVVDLAKLVRKIWDGLPNLMGLKVDVKIADLQLDPSAGQVSVADLKELVTRELQKQPDLLELWKEIAA